MFHKTSIIWEGNMIRKTISLLLAVFMLLSMARPTTAFAATRL